MATKKKPAKKKAPNYCICLWGLGPDTEKGAAIREICKELNIPTKTIKPEQLANPVGNVAGMIGFVPSLKPFDGEAPLEEFMLLNNLPNKTMDSFLKTSRERNAVVGPKAMVTPFNKKWPLVQLMTEIAKERAEIEAAQANPSSPDSSLSDSSSPSPS